MLSTTRVIQGRRDPSGSKQDNRETFCVIDCNRVRLGGSAQMEVEKVKEMDGMKTTLDSRTDNHSKKTLQKRPKFGNQMDRSCLVWLIRPVATVLICGLPFIVT